MHATAHRDVPIVHCVRRYIITYYTASHDLFSFVDENRITYSFALGMIYRSKNKRQRERLVTERLVVNARSCSESQRICKQLY